MNSLSFRWTALGALLSVVYPSSPQGPLTPPGAPGPTFKTLDEVEPRRPISSLPFSIGAAGSYYLTSSLISTGQSGIVIEADDVTLDLMGFTLSGTTNSSGVTVSGFRRNVRVRNGTMANWIKGVDAANANTSQFEDVHVINSSVVGMDTGANCLIARCSARTNAVGIVVGYNSRVIECTVTGNRGIGLVAQDGCVVQGCTASGNTNFGIATGWGVTLIGCVANLNRNTGILLSEYCVVKGCTAMMNGFGGISTPQTIQFGGGCVIENCAVGQNTGPGIIARGSTVKNCSVTRNSLSGIEVLAEALILENDCVQNGTGILVSGGNNRIEGNHMTGNATNGLRVTVADNFIVKNTARGNGTNYVIVTGNKVGAIVAAPNSGAISGNSGGAGVGTTDPWANFSF